MAVNPRDPKPSTDGLLARAEASSQREDGFEAKTNAAAASSRSNARLIVVLILQRSTIELLEAYGVAAAPAGPVLGRPLDLPPNHLVGRVSVSAGTRRGRLTLSTSEVTLARTKRNAPESSVLLDWLRELTNQLGGRIANRFARYQLPMTTGLPTTFQDRVSKADVDREDKSAPTLSLAFLVLRDTIHVTLTGGFENDELMLQSEPLAVTGEGEVILF
jgi:hypothetical protein